MIVEPGESAGYSLRYGLSTKYALDAVEISIGGKHVSTTTEGYQRFPIQIRVQRSERDDIVRLRGLLRSYVQANVQDRYLGRFVLLIIFVLLYIICHSAPRDRSRDARDPLCLERRRSLAKAPQLPKIRSEVRSKKSEGSESRRSFTH